MLWKLTLGRSDHAAQQAQRAVRNGIADIMFDTYDEESAGKQSVRYAQSVRGHQAIQPCEQLLNIICQLSLIGILLF